jgi:hypothetical protein
VQPTSYILPLRLAHPADEELIRYVRGLTRYCEVIVVDGSPREVFDSFAARCGRLVRHVAPAADHAALLNGKVAGVLTGLALASHERLVIADDDVRYGLRELQAVSDALADADVVRPQNYFDPMPWHARLDTARTLINRVSGGDWPGTLAVRRSVLQRTGGYDGNVMFENLELVRTVLASGGRAATPRGIYVRRLPPSTDHFASQRVRQAYDELARPGRMLLWLSVLPMIALVARRRGARAAAAALALPIVVAEAGRRVEGGRERFPASASLLAPAWVLERAVSMWVALGARLVLGGVPYRGRIVRTAATPMRELKRRYVGAGHAARPATSV